MNVLPGLSVSLEVLLNIENDPTILEPVCGKTGIPLWVLLRTPFIRAFLYDTLYGQAPSAPFAKIPPIIAARTTAKSLVRNWRKRDNIECDILIVATGMGVMMTDGKWFNRLSDQLALQYPDNTTVIEDVFAWRWPFPRDNDRVLLGLPAAVGATVIGRASFGKYLNQANALVTYVTQRAQDILGWVPSDNSHQMLVKHLAYKIASLPWLFRHWTHVLQKSGAKLLLKEEGCYGPSAVAISAARKLGIITAEYQHGAVSRGHDAYNVAPVLQASEAYRATLPDYFLGYGQWWIDQINIPVRGISLGNPHRSEILARSTARLSKPRPTILILGDGVDDGMYLAWSKRLAEKLTDEFTIVFRPHPSSLANGVIDILQAKSTTLKIDCGPDLYTSLIQTDVVVSELSTGLFEAIGLVKRIFMWATAKSAFSFPESPFEHFSDIDELVRRLRLPEAEIPLPIEGEIFWAPDWRSNYRRFLDDVRAFTVKEHK